MLETSARIENLHPAFSLGRINRVLVIHTFVRHSLEYLAVCRCLFPFAVLSGRPVRALGACVVVVEESFRVLLPLMEVRSSI